MSSTTNSRLPSLRHLITSGQLTISNIPITYCLVLNPFIINSAKRVNQGIGISIYIHRNRALLDLIASGQGNTI